MKARVPLIDSIWRVRDSVLLEERLSPEEAFARLEPLLLTSGTEYDVAGDTLTYAKQNPAAQDKLATFTSGTLRLSVHGDGSRLSYDVGSTALLLCFLAPLLFLGFAQLAVGLSALEGPEIEDARSADKKDADEDREDRLHWIDQMLGAPVPETPEEKKEKEKEKEGEQKHSPTSAYALAGIFAVLYVVGRILEAWLIKRTFRNALTGRKALTGDLYPTARTTVTPVATDRVAPPLRGSEERP